MFKIYTKENRDYIIKNNESKKYCAIDDIGNQVLIDFSDYIASGNADKVSREEIITESVAYNFLDNYLNSIAGDFKFEDKNTLSISAIKEFTLTGNRCKWFELSDVFISYSKDAYLALYEYIESASFLAKEDGIEFCKNKIGTFEEYYLARGYYRVEDYLVKNENK